MSRFSALADTLAKQKPMKGDDDEILNPEDEAPGEDEDENEEEPSMTTTTDQAAIETARADGFKEATDRATAVLASEHFAGREALATTLLGNAKLTSDEIIASLAVAPGGNANVAPALTEEQQRQAAEEGGRKEMTEALQTSANSNIDASQPPAPGEEAKVQAGWKNAAAAANRNAGFAE